MKKALLLSVLIALSLILASCATGQYLKNPERELKAEKIYVKRVGDKVSYKIKVTNISGESIYLGVKSFSDLSPNGKICEYSKEKKFVHVIRIIHVLTSYNNDKDKTGIEFLFLKKGESHSFSATISPKKCALQADKYINKYYIKNIPDDRKEHFVLSVGYLKRFSCRNDEDCKKIKKRNKSFILWDDDAIKKRIEGEGFVVSQFIFEFDEEKDEKE